MTDEELNAIEERVDASQRGPWVVASVYGDTVFLDAPTRGAMAWFDVRDSADAEFCAHAREDVPALVAEVRHLRAVGSLETRPEAETKMTTGFPSTYELERRYLDDAAFHARVYAFTAGRCKHDQSPCSACILDSLKIVARVPFPRRGFGVRRPGHQMSLSEEAERDPRRGIDMLRLVSELQDELRRERSVSQQYRDAALALINSHWAHHCSDGVGGRIAVSWEKFCDLWDVLHPESPSIDR